MDQARRAVRNVLAQLGSQAVTWLSSLVFTAALGRYLGDEGFGVLYLALALTGFFGVLVDFGLQPLVTREVARQPDMARRYFGYALAIKLAIWVLSFIAIQALALALGYDDRTRTVLMIYTVTMGVQAASYLMGAVFRGLERLGPVATGMVLEKGVNVVLGVAVLLRGAGVVAVAWVLLAGAVANLLWQAVVLLPELRGAVRPHIDRVFVRTLLVSAVPFAAYWFVSTIYWRIDAIMLERMADTAAVGAYGAAYRLFETLQFLPNIVAASVMMPLLARLKLESTSATRLAFEKGLNVLLVIGIPTCVAMLALARPILSFIYGRDEFLAAAPALQVLGVGVIVLYINSAVGWALLSLDQERRLIFVPSLALVLNVVLNIVLIPRWGGAGAAVATVLSELFIDVLFVAMLPRWLLPRRSLGVAARATAASAGMAAVLLVARDEPLPLLVLAGAASYAALGLALRVVPPDDLALLWRVVRRRPAAV